MNTKLILAAVASCLTVTACAGGPSLNMKSFSFGSQAPAPAVLDETGRFKILTDSQECPDCCVAITGTSHFFVNDEKFNFEVNTPAGRVNSVVLTNAAGTQTFFPIISARCILDTSGALIGAIVEADSDGNLGTVEGTFTLLGEPVGGHVKTVTIQGAVTTGFPFSSFGPANVDTGQNIFIDNLCDGTPN